MIKNRRVMIFVFFVLFSFVNKASYLQTTQPSPSNLTVELLEFPAKTTITDLKPEFGWVMNSAIKNDVQFAYQILVATSPAKLEKNIGDMWDTGKLNSTQSINVEYNGKRLSPNSTYFWKVKTWNKNKMPSLYSNPQQFKTGEKVQQYQTDRYLLEMNEIIPVKVVEKDKGSYFVDFGKAAFGTIQITVSSLAKKHTMEIHLGEAVKDGNKVNRKPGGTIRYRKIKLPVKQGTYAYKVSIPPDERNTRDRAIKMPGYIGEVLPFRYCEVKKCPSKLNKNSIKQLVVNYPFNDSATQFLSDSKVLNDVWELCKYSIKATSFCGTYVDGDRERIPYEADAYINQLCHYNVDREFTMGRYSHEYLIMNPTWPTEWILHSVLMAWADYLYTGNSESMENYYEDLKAKTLISLARDDGLISTTTGKLTDDVIKSIHFNKKIRDIVDWPPGSFTKGGTGERDNHVMGDINTVVNAFHYQALFLMSKIAQVLNKVDDAEYFIQRAEKVKHSINEKLFDLNRKIYVDGEGIDHASLHSNMFPLAFDLVPEEHKESVVKFIKSRGMACSVYGSQYLLEALYKAGEDKYALWLMTNDSDRSWPHMIYDVGTTITLEAWDWKYKNNLDWNHAWGAAPANIIPRYVMGIEPLEPGFGKFQIKPQVGELKNGSIDLATIRGTIHIDFKTDHKTFFKLNVRIPANTSAIVYLPKLGINNAVVDMNGKKRRGRIDGEFVVIDNVGSGGHEFVR
ncbi:family 78 glycoside hydrolase catalytic domain [candidate division KSB1 bacterium]|nr:family 78 glycoside hydrolase catalytic domain [candidate division KSB1 bacterium]